MRQYCSPNTGLAILMVLTLLISVPHPSDSSSQINPSRTFSLKYHSITNDDDNKYAVVFDAGSTGSRVHAFKFDKHSDLLPLAGQFEFFSTTKPGLSSYPDDPKAAAQSLKPLLDQAQAVVPNKLRPQTPLRLGATAGLRLLGGDKSERILQAVRELFKSESNLNYKAEWVSILDGFQEASYMWVAINYLLENLGKEYSKTVGVVDLGGGSVQMSYAISDESAANAPYSASDEDAYVEEKHLKGSKYNIYAHSYLNYGRNSFRAEILKLTGDHPNPCVTNGYQGTYEYSGVIYKASSPKRGTSIKKCRSLTRKALKLDATCPHKNCTFNGAWSGGGGDGQKSLYIASYFYDTAVWASILEESATSAKIRPITYLEAAKVACTANVDNINSKFSQLEDRNVPFFCMDLTYLYTLLVDGFGIDPTEEVTAVKQIEYKGSMIESAWPLGCAVSSLSPSKSQLYPTMHIY